MTGLRRVWTGQTLTTGNTSDYLTRLRHSAEPFPGSLGRRNIGEDMRRYSRPWPSPFARFLMLGVAALDKARDDNLLWAVKWVRPKLPSALASQSPLTGPSHQSWLSVFMMEEICSALGRTPHSHPDVWNCSDHTSHQHTDCEGANTLSRLKLATLSAWSGHNTLWAGFSHRVMWPGSPHSGPGWRCLTCRLG